MSNSIYFCFLIPGYRPGSVRTGLPRSTCCGRATGRTTSCWLSPSLALLRFVININNCLWINNLNYCRCGPWMDRKKRLQAPCWRTRASSWGDPWPSSPFSFSLLAGSDLFLFVVVTGAVNGTSRHSVLVCNVDHFFLLDKYWGASWKWTAPFSPPSTTWFHKGVFGFSWKNTDCKCSFALPDWRTAINPSFKQASLCHGLHGSVGSKMLSPSPRRKYSYSPSRDMTILHSEDASQHHPSLL
jgi:hypothetical protein